MSANHSPGDALSPFERRRLEELRRELEADDPTFAATSGRGRSRRARTALLATLAVLATAVAVMGAVIMIGFASVVGCLCSAFTMYGIFKLCSTTDRAREQ
jgi:Flp pilus assembly protein TadB